MVVVETFSGKRLIAVSAGAKTKKLAIVAEQAMQLTAGHSRTVLISLSTRGRSLLSSNHKLPVELNVSQIASSGRSTLISAQKLIFEAPDA
jgi:hypothetical protein